MIAIIFVISTLIIQGIQPQNLECISCTDRGDHGCDPGNATKVTCEHIHNVCIEAVTSLETSHGQFTWLMKGCAYGGSGRFDKAIPFNGITMFMQINQCNTSLCNTNMVNENYQLLPPDSSTRQPNEAQCYSCIGISEDQCLTSNSSVMKCFNNYESCFDGNASISIGNATTVIPIKSCSVRDICPRKTVTIGAATFGIKGACCRGNLCNQDLSNQTQYGEGPPLILLNDHNEEDTTTVEPPPKITTAHNLSHFTDKAHKLTTVHGVYHPAGPVDVYRENGMGVLSNATLDSDSLEHLFKNNKTNNASRLPINMCVFICVVFILFMC